MRDIINEKYKYSEPQTKFIELINSKFEPTRLNKS